MNPSSYTRRKEDLLGIEVFDIEPRHRTRASKPVWLPVLRYRKTKICNTNYESHLWASPESTLVITTVIESEKCDKSFSIMAGSHQTTGIETSAETYSYVLQILTIAKNNINRIRVYRLALVNKLARWRSKERKRRKWGPAYEVGTCFVTLGVSEYQSQILRPLESLELARAL
jgi:hypothetical protein